MDKKTDDGYLYIKANNQYVNGIVGTDIKLTLKQKIEILFSKGISVVLYGTKGATDGAYRMGKIIIKGGAGGTNI